MAVMEDRDPVMIFAGYEKPMEKFLNVNRPPGRGFIESLSFWTIPQKNSGRRRDL